MTTNNSESIKNENGKVVFSGTDIVISIFFNYLKAGKTTEEFLDDYPTVNLQQLIDALDLADDQLTHHFLSVKTASF